jgi:hypothetical protein
MKTPLLHTYYVSAYSMDDGCHLLLHAPVSLTFVRALIVLTWPIAPLLALI